MCIVWAHLVYAACVLWSRLARYRRVVRGWSTVARKLRSLKDREQLTGRRLHRYHLTLVWNTWRRERYVQAMVEVHGVQKLLAGPGIQLGLLTVLKWKGDDTTSVLIQCWRDWRRRVHRCGLQKHDVYV
jgi:hypothetical protein